MYGSSQSVYQDGCYCQFFKNRQCSLCPFVGALHCNCYLDLSNYGKQKNTVGTSGLEVWFPLFSPLSLCVHVYLLIHVCLHLYVLIILFGVFDRGTNDYCNGQCISYNHPCHSIHAHEHEHEHAHAHVHVHVHAHRHKNVGNSIISYYVNFWLTCTIAYQAFDSCWLWLLYTYHRLYVFILSVYFAI